MREVFAGAVRIAQALEFRKAVPAESARLERRAGLESGREAGPSVACRDRWQELSIF